MKQPPFFLASFLLVSAAEMLSLAAGWETMHHIAKPLIMVSLAGLYLAGSEQRSWIFFWALGCCWMGDVLLLFQEHHEWFFMGGLVAFLTGHVVYILAYRKFQWKTDGRLMTTQKLRFSLPIVLAGTGLIAILYPSLGPLRVPVVLYAVVLMLMVMTALFRYGRTSSKSFWLIFGGAALFMISDSALALNKFFAPFSYSGPFIMLTYISAQYFIVLGAMRHSPE